MALATAGSLIGCGSDGNEPADVAKSYALAIADGDVETACSKLSGPAKREATDEANGKSCPEIVRADADALGEEEKAALRKDANAEPKITLSGSLAQVDVGRSLSARLEKLDGKWLITDPAAKSGALRAEIQQEEEAVRRTPDPALVSKLDAAIPAGIRKRYISRFEKVDGRVVIVGKGEDPPSLEDIAKACKAAQTAGEPSVRWQIGSNDQSCDEASSELDEIDEDEAIAKIVRKVAPDSEPAVSNGEIETFDPLTNSQIKRACAALKAADFDLTSAVMFIATEDDEFFRSCPGS